MPLTNKDAPRSNHVSHSKHPSSADSHAPYASSQPSSSVVSDVQNLPRQPNIFCPPISAATSSITPSSSSKKILTEGEGDCAFHAIFGVKNEGKFSCQNVDKIRQVFVEWLKDGNAHGPNIETLITECIRDLISEDKLPIGFEETAYSEIMDARTKSKTGQNIDITTKILEEYYKWVGGKGHWMLRGEIQLIAHAFNRTIICRSANQAEQTFNPGQAETVTIYFTGNHYEQIENPSASFPSHFSSGNASYNQPTNHLRNSQHEPITDKTIQSSLTELKLRNKQKDMQILYRMLLSIIQWEETGQKNTEEIFKTIASLAGGAVGITFRTDDLDCIRYRYGRNSPDHTEIEGSINLEKLHRAFIVLQAGKIPTQDISSDLKILKSKICFILHKELALHCATLPPLLVPEEIAFLKNKSPEGNSAPLSHIYQYVQEHYYHISLERIKTELQYFSGNIKTKDDLKDDLYFIARKFIIIGELGYEIEKDVNKLDLDTKKPFLSFISALTPFIDWRHKVIHSPAKLIQQFEASPEALNTKINTQVNTLTSTLNATSADDLAKARKKPKNTPSTRHRSKTKNSKLTSFLQLSDAIPKVNAEKIVKAQIWFNKFIENHADARKLIENIENFNLATKEKCTELLLTFAIQEIKKQRTIEKQFYQALLNDLEKLASIYTSNPVSAKTLTEELLSQSEELCQKLAEEMGLPVGELLNTADSVLQTLNYIAPEKITFIWQPKQDEWKRLVITLNDAYEAHDIPDIKLPAKQIRQENKYNQLQLIKNIEEEIIYLLDVDERVQNPDKKRTIQEYVVTLIGQYMRELSEISPLQETLLSQDSYRAGAFMLQARSKGLAHEVLRFDAQKFEENIRNIVFSASNDFYALNIVHLYKHNPSQKIKALYTVAQAYLILGLYDEAIKLLTKAMDIKKQDKDIVNKEKKEANLTDVKDLPETSEKEKKIAKNLTKIMNINLQEIILGTGFYTFELMGLLAHVYHLKGDYQEASKVAQELLHSLTNNYLTPGQFISRFYKEAQFLEPVEEEKGKILTLFEMFVAFLDKIFYTPTTPDINNTIKPLLTFLNILKLFEEPKNLEFLYYFLPADRMSINPKDLQDQIDQLINNIAGLHVIIALGYVNNPPKNNEKANEYFNMAVDIATKDSFKEYINSLKEQTDKEMMDKAREKETS